jgi:hypothetical protein
MTWKLCVFYVIICVVMPSWAQTKSESLSGTTRVYFQALESRCVLIGCSVVFSGALEDTTYERGDIVGISGSVVVYLVGEGKAKRLAPGFKVGILKDSGAGLQMTAVPDFVYAKSSGGSMARSILASEESDTKGMRSVVVQFDSASIGLMRDVSQAKTVFFVYSRGARGLDVVVPVDFSVVAATFAGEIVTRKRDPREGQAFERCLGQLAEQK